MGSGFTSSCKKKITSGILSYKIIVGCLINNSILGQDYLKTTMDFFFVVVVCLGDFGLFLLC